MNHPGRQSNGCRELEAEFERLSNEAVTRLQEGKTLPALSSLYAIQPLIGNLLAQLSSHLGVHGHEDDEGMNTPGGVYL